MTEQRKKYLNNISKEERAIRGQINISKHRIKLLKKFIVEDNQDCMFTLEEKQTIATEKHIIKALKKQLPAPRKAYQNEYLDYCLCPICRWYANHHTNYCSKCGQKLR